MKCLRICLLFLCVVSSFWVLANDSIAFASSNRFTAEHDQNVKKGKTAQDYFEQGVDYQNRYLYDQAIQAYTESVNLGGKFADLYYNRGCAYGEIHSYDDALADFNKVIELMPQNAEAYYNRGVIYDAKELHEKALVDYDMAIALQPQYSDAYYNKAVSLDNLGRFEEAKTAYVLFIQYAQANDRDLLFAKERLQVFAQES